MPSPKSPSPAQLAILERNRQTIERQFYDSVPFATILGGLDGITRDALRSWCRMQKFDFIKRAVVQQSRWYLISQRLKDGGLDDAPRETDRQAAMWVKLLKGRHFGHRHAKHFIPDKRFCLPPTHVPRGTSLGQAIDKEAQQGWP